MSAKIQYFKESSNDRWNLISKLCFSHSCCSSPPLVRTRREHSDSFERDKFPVMTFYFQKLPLIVLERGRFMFLYAVNTMLLCSEAVGVNVTNQRTGVRFMSRATYALKPASPVRSQVCVYPTSFQQFEILKLT